MIEAIPFFGRSPIQFGIRSILPISKQAFLRCVMELGNGGVTSYEKAMTNNVD